MVKYLKDSLCELLQCSEMQTANTLIINLYILGIQEEIPSLGSANEFKLKGNPFWRLSSGEEAILARKLAANILFMYYNQGLKLLVSSNLSQTTDVTTWIFHRETAIISQFGFACVGISSKDKLQFIGFHCALHQFLHNFVSQNWPKTLQMVKTIGDTLEIKLVGNPWLPEDDSESIQSKVLIKALVMPWIIIIGYCMVQAI